jgi:hypothetical protein
MNHIVGLRSAFRANQPVGLRISSNFIVCVVIKGSVSITERVVGWTSAHERDIPEDAWISN